jgi:hypothetical protein
VVPRGKVVVQPAWCSSLRRSESLKVLTGKKGRLQPGFGSSVKIAVNILNP